MVLTRVKTKGNLEQYVGNANIEELLLVINYLPSVKEARKLNFLTDCDPKFLGVKYTENGKDRLFIYAPSDNLEICA